METQNTFAAQVAANEMSKKHAEEIMNTRVGGLGGSDASILYKIGMNGMSALSATDHKRLSVMMGITPSDNFGGNVYTNAGHAFEDWAEQNIPWGKSSYEREKVLTQPLALNFKVFAHADFVINKVVVECKFVQGTTQSCATKYAAQLQWYYMLGAKEVQLFHGTGTAEPFEVWDTTVRIIERDEQMIDYLLEGIKTLDEAISNGWKPESVEKVVLADTPTIVQQAFMTVAEISAKIKVLEEKKKSAAAVLIEYIEGFGLSGILAGNENKHQVIYNKAGVSKAFDVAKLSEEHPEINIEKYYKTTRRAASIMFK